MLQSVVGRDLGDVRVRAGAHEDARLDAAGVDALAQGRDVLVRRDHDRPGTLGGRALLLHELVHVLQQQDGHHEPGSPATSATDQEEQASRVSVALAARPPLPPGAGLAAVDCPSGRPAVRSGGRPVAQA